MSTPTEPVPINLARLPGMTLAQLRAVWDDLMSHANARTRITAPVQRSLLLREIAWRVQAHGLPDGVIDPQVQRRLDAAVRAVISDQAKPNLEALRTRSKPASGTPMQRLADAATLPAMTKLVRVFRGIRHEITVIDGGARFRYQGREYRSLSRIAYEITGTVWSGPKFFGLSRRTIAGPTVTHGGEP